MQRVSPGEKAVWMSTSFCGASVTFSSPKNCAAACGVFSPSQKYKVGKNIKMQLNHFSLKALILALSAFNKEK